MTWVSVDTAAKEMGPQLILAQLLQVPLRSVLSATCPVLSEQAEQAGCTSADIGNRLERTPCLCFVTNNNQPWLGTCTSSQMVMQLFCCFVPTSIQDFPVPANLLC